MNHLKDHDIICLALPSWEGEYLKATVALVRPLSEENRLLYVDYPRTWTDILKGCLGKIKVPFSRVFGLKNRVTRPDENNNLWLLTLPPVFPVRFLPKGRIYRWAQSLNALIIARTIIKAKAELGMERPVVINAFQPGLGLAMMGRLDEQITAYYCYDNISAADWCSKHGPSDEHEYLPKVDFVITTSEALWEEKERRSLQCFLIQNGVDYPLFSKVKRSQHHRLAQTGFDAVLGYVGCIDTRIDWQLIKTIAQENQNWRIDMIGPVVYPEVQEQLSTCLNVRFLGSAKQSELPDLMSDFDLGIIPFVENPFTKFIYPMKVNEYLAAGLPVVMTPFAEISALKDAVTVAPADHRFIPAISQALASDNETEQNTRKVFAQQNSWDARSRQLSKILATYSDAYRAA